MALKGSNPKKPDDSRLQGYRQVALATTIPLVMLVAPAVGYFLGSYLDSLLGTSKLMTVLLLLLGVVAGGVESYRIIREIIKEGD